LRPAPDCRPRRALLHLSYSSAPSFSDSAFVTHALNRPSCPRQIGPKRRAPPIARPLALEPDSARHSAAVSGFTRTRTRALASRIFSRRDNLPRTVLIYFRSSSGSVQPCSGRSPRSGSSAPILVRSKTGVPSAAVVTASDLDG